MNHIGTREIATERLTLRRFEIEDAENVFYKFRIGYWQDVCCEVLQVVSVGTVKNLSSQYIYTHALQALAVPDMQDLIMAGAL